MKYIFCIRLRFKIKFIEQYICIKTKRNKNTLRTPIETRIQNGRIRDKTRTGVIIYVCKTGSLYSDSLMFHAHNEI